MDRGRGRTACSTTGTSTTRHKLRICGVLASCTGATAARAAAALRDSSNNSRDIARVATPDSRRLQDDLSRCNISSCKFRSSGIFFRLPVHRLPRDRLSISLDDKLASSGTGSRVTEGFNGGFCQCCYGSAGRTNRSSSLTLGGVRCCTICSSNSITSGVTSPRAFLDGVRGHTIGSCCVVRGNGTRSSVLSISSSSSLSVCNCDNCSRALSGIGLCTRVSASFSTSSACNALGGTVRTTAGRANSCYVCCFTTDTTTYVVFFIVSVELTNHGSPDGTRTRARATFASGVPTSVRFTFTTTVRTLTF